MEIEITPEFKESFKKRANQRIQKLFRERLKLFQKNPHDSSLRNHALDYELKGKRSWSLTDDKSKDDYRVLYYSDRRKRQYVFIDFGTHDQLYRSWKTKKKKQKLSQRVRAVITFPCSFFTSSSVSVLSAR